MLRIHETVPDEFVDADPEDLVRILGAPSLMHLDGRRREPLFVSVLLHGNELTGLQAVQALLRRYRSRELPRALSIFVGNVEAARYGVRRLDGQPDFNRIWPGCRSNGSPEQAMMRRILDEMEARGVFASVDIHNNTGLNPHYACVNRLEHRFFHLATLFSRTVVYFTKPAGVQSTAFARLCPSVTVECGQSGQALSVEHALEYLEACLHLSELPDHPVPEHDMDLFHTMVTVKVPPEVSFGFGEAEADIIFEEDLDHLNFRELAVGTVLGRIRSDERARLEAWDNTGRDVGDEYFAYDGNEIRIRRPVMPSMLTLNERIIRQDCLGYFMERLVDVRGEE